MSSHPIDLEHPLEAAVRTVEEALDSVMDADPLYLRPAAKADLLPRLGRAVDRLESLRLRMLAASGDLAAAFAHRDAGGWLTANTVSDSAPNHASYRLAEDLERWGRVGDGLADGRVSLAQAKVVVRALNDLSPDLDQEWITKAEIELVRLCATLTPKQLRKAGDAILEMIAPDLAEDEERKKLEAEERKARAETRLEFRHRGDGTTDIHARVPDAVASRLKTYLESFSSPRHKAAEPDESLIDPATGKYLPIYRIRGMAFCAFLEAADPARMPLHGGDATTCVVTMKLSDLMAGTGIATLGDGTRISAGEARRLACTAGIIPAVLGTDSEVLDLGRSSRLFNKPQRKAMALEHPTCRAEGCTIPAPWCEAHHFGQPWAKGGNTDLKDGMLLCSFHHHCADDDTYLHELLPNGDVRFYKRM